MRDGIMLRGTLFAPPGRSRFPVILSRTPYGRSGEFARFVNEGYGVICEDVRGRGQSSGKWEPFLNERKDGYDTIEWIARQSWCDGNVGMIGASYLGYVQWAAASEHPPHLKCIVPIVSPPDPFQNLPYENGCFLLPVSLWYTSIIGRTTRIPYGANAENNRGFQTWPLGDADLAVVHGRNDIFQKWVRMESPEDWRSAETIQDAASIDIPSFSISGWFDGDQVGTQLRWAASTFEDRWLVYGPWGHTLGIQSRAGDLAIQAGEVPDLSALESAFFARYLKNHLSAMSGVPHVQSFVLGANKWVRDDQWPPAKSVSKKVYLSVDGKLQSNPDTVLGSRTYEMDPTHVRAFRHLRQDPLDDTAPYRLTSDDLPYGHLIYDADAFAEPTIVTGPLAADLTFSTDTPDADFFIQPLDGSPDGSYIPIGQGGRFRARRMLNLPHLEPGKIYSAKVTLWDSLFQVAAGHHLALMISSDRYPVYALNSNTGEPQAKAAHPIKTHPRIYSGKEAHQEWEPSSFTFSTMK